MFYSKSDLPNTLAILRRNFVFAFLVLGVCTSSKAGDWPQIMGPNRNGVASNETLMKSWPKNGLKTLWNHKVGSGYAGVAVQGETVVAFHRKGDEQIVEALNATTGKQIWKQSFATDYRCGFSSDSGPRCVPIIHKNAVYVYSPSGKLFAYELSKGTKKWLRDLFKDYSAQEGFFGAGSTPIILKDRIFVNVGGRKDAGLVALNIANGKTVWNSSNFKASYAAPISIKVGGAEKLLFVTRLETAIVDPSTGEVASKFRFGEPGATVNAAIPLYNDGKVFLTASYNIGAKMYQLAESNKFQFRSVWENDAMSSQYTSSIWHKGFIYGTD